MTVNWKNLWTKSKRVLFIVAVVVAFFMLAFVAGRCSTRQERDNQMNNLLALQDTVHASVVTINGLKSTVFEKQSLILTQKQAIDVGIVEQERLKKLALKEIATNAELEGTIKVLRDSLKLVPGTTIITVKDSSGITADYVKIPFTLLNEEEKNLHLIAGMNLNKTAYFDLTVPFTGTMTVGYKKAGLFKTTPVGVFTTTNPYIRINTMDVVIIQQPKDVFSKWWFHMALGAGAFYGIQYGIKQIK
jgi:hypothetical protein